MNIMKINNSFDILIEDLEYIKSFKCPSILFMDTGYPVGLGEMMSYIRTEIGINRNCIINNAIIETKNIGDIIKGYSNRDDNSNWIGEWINPTTISFGGRYELVTGISPNYIRCGIERVFDEISGMSVIYEEDLTKSDILATVKKMKVDDGLVNYPIITSQGSWFIPMNKKYFPMVAGDKLILNVLQHNNFVHMGYHYIIFRVIKKNGLVFDTILKILDV